MSDVRSQRQAQGLDEGLLVLNAVEVVSVWNSYQGRTGHVIDSVGSCVHPGMVSYSAYDMTNYHNNTDLMSAVVSGLAVDDPRRPTNTICVGLFLVRPDGTLVDLWPIFQQYWGGETVAAVLPASRSVQVNTTATAFASVFNAGTTLASGVGISLASSLPARFKYNSTNCATNAMTGGDTVPVDLASGTQACYVLSITPSAPFAPMEVAFTFQGNNTGPVTTLVGINTLLMSASETPVPDIVSARCGGDPGIVTMRRQ